MFPSIFLASHLFPDSLQSLHICLFASLAALVSGWKSDICCFFVFDTLSSSFLPSLWSTSITVLMDFPLMPIITHFFSEITLEIFALMVWEKRLLLLKPFNLILSIEFPDVFDLSVSMMYFLSKGVPLLPQDNPFPSCKDL